MRCVFLYFKNDSFYIQVQHVVVFATKWLETLLLKLNGLKSQNKGNNKITELRTILQRESQNS